MHKQLKSDLVKKKSRLNVKSLKTFEEIRNSTYALQPEVDAACCAQILPHGDRSWDSTPGMNTEAVTNAKPRTVERRTMVLD